MAERLLMGLLIVGVAVGCGVVLLPFLSAMLWAAILVFTTWPAAQFLRTRFGLHRALVALLMMLATGLVLMVPLSLAAPAGADDVAALRRQVEDFLAQIPPAPPFLYATPLIGHTLADYWNAWAADLSSMATFFRPYFGMVAQNGLLLLLHIANGLVEFVLALFIAFFFWLSGDAMGRQVQVLMRRIAGPYADELIAVTGRTVRGTVFGILGTAIIQGFLTAFGLGMAGVPRAVLLATVAAFLAVLPIGAPLVWAPAAIWLLASGHTGQGVFLLVYGLIVVSGADHIIRPYFISRGAQLPYLLTVLGVLGGVLAFGVLGIFLGPVLLGVGYTLVMEFSRPRAVTAAAGVPP